MSEDRSIKDVYDHIAAHFSRTREYPWPEVTSYLQKTEGSQGIDIGCGNGRHTESMTEAVDVAVGIDLSRGLLEEARERSESSGFAARFIQGSATAVPTDGDTFDVGLYIATIHHLRARETRIDSLDELARVLTPDGTALISAWSTEHEQFDATEGFDTAIDWTLPDGETVPRFYHIYAPDEFEDDIRKSNLDLVDSQISSGNCYAEVRPE